MEQRIFHGNLTPNTVAQALVAQFNRGNLRAHILGDANALHVQIATRADAASGGQTGLSVNIQKVSDGVMVSISDQAWLGVAADMGHTIISAFQNPWNLLGRLDDIAQDVESLQITEKVWQVVAAAAKAAGASTQISERLRKSTCEFCGTGNEINAGSCVACGAPLGNNQPRTCMSCGFVILRDEKSCPNCKKVFV
jgi:hypothetical protein